jgi:hypothetical protein
MSKHTSVRIVPEGAGVKVTGVPSPPILRHPRGPVAEVTLRNGAVVTIRLKKRGSGANRLGVAFGNAVAMQRGLEEQAARVEQEQRVQRARRRTRPGR